jgi:hypothetical protein
MFACSVAAVAQSPQTCPWLNSGTAAKALGAERAATAHSDSNWSGSCRFSTQTNPPRAIEISVGKADSHPCGANGTSVGRLGNEATLCSVRGADGQKSQVLTGRVRDAWFVVTMTMPHTASGNSPSGSEDADSSLIRFLAEQVTGNLY